jgi:23S rRNA (adenine2030-N6)-methyltransferase
MKALLPPAPRRALTLIDPSYELAEDYSKVVGALREALARFATGIVMIWYPMLRNRDADSLPERLRQVAGDRWLDVRLTVRPRTGDRPGLYGSGVFIANPPFGLADTLRSAMPELVELLGDDGNAGYELAFETP